MKPLRISFLLTMIFLFGSGAMAATQYGNAVIEKGSMTVVREGRSLKFDQVDQEIPINEDDLLRVRPNSLVILNSREKAQITLGGNAIFHVKPWQSKGKTGFMRALFGKFRASVVNLLGGEQFNVRTATATIGVKGTEYQTQVTNRGTTLTIVRESVVGFQGQRGAEVDIGEGMVSVVININPATPPVPVPPAVAAQHGRDNLEAPAPNGPQGGTLAGERGLIEAGILTEEDLNEGKGDIDLTPPRVPSTEEELIEAGILREEDLNKSVPIFTPPRDIFDPKDADDAVKRGRVRIIY